MSSRRAQITSLGHEICMLSIISFVSFVLIFGSRWEMNTIILLICFVLFWEYEHEEKRTCFVFLREHTRRLGSPPWHWTSGLVTWLKRLRHSSNCHCRLGLQNSFCAQLIYRAKKPENLSINISKSITFAQIIFICLTSRSNCHQYCNWNMIPKPIIKKLMNTF